MDKIKVVVHGAAGKMGQLVGEKVKQHYAFELIGGIDVKSGRICGQKILYPGEQSASIIENADVVIDFSTPEATMLIASKCIQHCVALVTGTTGLSGDQVELLRSGVSNLTACVQSSNFGVGTNVMMKLVEKAAEIFSADWNVEILELHHKLKKDAPSGTALILGRLIAEKRNQVLEQVANFERHGQIGERSDSEIGMQTIRGGTIVGDHTVFFCGAGERLEITHRAQSRELFATGALMAAHWVVGKEPGMYSFADDVLGLKKYLR